MLYKLLGLLFLYGLIIYTVMQEGTIIWIASALCSIIVMEIMLHSILKVRGKKIEKPHESEWFDTNPDEVIELIEFVNKELLDS